jgi:hypothetical protein
MERGTQTVDSTRVAGFGHSAATDAETAGRESVRMAFGGRTPKPGDLVLIFPSAPYDLDALHGGALAEAGPAAVVGATTVGAFTREAQLTFGCVAIALSGDEASFGVCHVERDDADIAGVTRGAAETARERAGERHPHSVLLLLCDGLTPDQREVARGAYAATSAVIPLIGAAAGDDLHWQATYTFGEGRILSNGLVAVWINSPSPMAVGVAHGYRPFGRPMLVTRAEGSVIHELDGQPALDVYLSERGVAVKDDARSIGDMLVERPIGIPTAQGGYDMRHIHEATADGGLVLTTGVPEQTVIQVMAGDDESLLEGARQAAEVARRDLDGAPRAAVVFSCCGRVPLLRARVAEEVELIATELGDVPAGGFYSCGEFARATGSTGIHNSVVALLLL